MTSLAYRIKPDFERGPLPVIRPTLSPGESARTPSIPDEADHLRTITGDAGTSLPANDAAAGPATILVVEDEKYILTVVADYLRDRGFNVLEATSTKEAKRALASTVAINLLFSDVRLPGDSGFELARWCQQTRPDVRILLTSGFYDPPADAGRFSVLPKPYSLRELVARLEPLLPPRTKAPRPADVPAGGERPPTSFLSRPQRANALVEEDSRDDQAAWPRGHGPYLRPRRDPPSHKTQPEPIMI